MKGCRMLCDRRAWCVLMLLAAASVGGLAWTGRVSGAPGEDLPHAAQSRTITAVPVIPPVQPEAAGQHTTRPSRAMVLERRGWGYIQAGNYTAAKAAFSHAMGLDRDKASVMVGLGLSYQLLGNDARAIAALERAIRLDMAVGQAHALLGDLYTRRGELERALHHFRLAQRQEPGDMALAHRLELTEAEYRAELELDRVYSEHFQVKFRARATDSRLVHRIADRLEGVYHQVGQALSFYPAGVFTVIVYPDREFWKTTNSPGWVRGLFDGAIHLPALAARQDSRVAQRLLRHEYVHAVADRLSAGRVPVWLSEGLALYLEEHEKPAEDVFRSESVNDGVSRQTFYREFIVLSPREAQVAYARSYRATHALIQQYGLGRVRALVEALSSTSDFSQAFNTAFQTPFSEFEAEWLAHPMGQRF